MLKEKKTSKSPARKQKEYLQFNQTNIFDVI